MKIKTSELIGKPLDWAVLKCLLGDAAHYTWEHTAHRHRYSTDWAQGGPLIEQEKIGVFAGLAEHGWAAHMTGEHSWVDTSSYDEITGSTPLIAAMRCYVASKLGDEVEVPDELA